jgi:hypothetical protein
MPRVRQQDALLPGFEVFHHFEDNDIHVMVVAVRRLVVERQIARRLDFGPIGLAPGSNDLETPIGGKRLISFTNGFQEVEIRLEIEALAVGIVLKGGIQEPRIVARRTQIGLDVPLLVARNQFQKDDRRVPLEGLVVDQLAVEIKRFDGGMHRVVENHEVVLVERP